MNPTAKKDSPTKARITWSTSQSDLSAGMGGWIPLGTTGEEDIMIRAKAMIVPPKMLNRRAEGFFEAARRMKATRQSAAAKNTRAS